MILLFSIKGGSRWTALLLFLCLFAAGCVQFSAKPPGSWYDAYQPITDAAADDFIDAALVQARGQFGEPAVPVNRVLLRRSRKADAARGYRIQENFSLTECVDADSGFFVIYMGVDVRNPDFYPYLGHECMHLLNPYITDWYMEGMATVFSEELCAASGIEWAHLRRRFMADRDEPYAVSYRLAKALQAAYPEDYPRLASCVAPNRRASAPWMRIDIDAWIASLPPARRGEALKIIASYAKKLDKVKRALYDFKVPAGIE